MSTDKNLPPIDENDLPEETAPTDPQRTRGNLSNEEDTGKLHRTAPIRTRPPAQTGHVQPIPGQHPRTPPPPRYRPRPPQKPRTQSDSGLYLPWWSLALMLVGVLVVSFGLVGLVFLLGNPTGIVDDATPIIRIITAEPTLANSQQLPTAQSPATQVISGASVPSNLSLEGPTLEAVQFTPTPIPITVGAQIAVEGVGENMLNVREAPGIGNAIVFRAEEEAIFTIVEGPSQADGFTWWRLQDPSNATRTGWAVSNYLRVLPGAETP